MVRVRGQQGVTLVELLVALAIASILILGVIAAFQTTQRTAAIGEAREQIYQNGRVALDLMAREIKNAYIDPRNRDLVFISADGLAARGNSILQYDPANPSNRTINPSLWVYGLGNAQVPFGIDPTGSRIPNELIRLYADETFGYPLFNSAFSIKAITDIYTIAPGPPDRLDFSSFTSVFAGSADQSRLAEVRYMISTETFVDDKDNDYDGDADENDDTPYTTAVDIPGVGDLIPVLDRDDYHPVTRKILALSLFHLRRGTGIYDPIGLGTPPGPDITVPVVDKNPFSTFDLFAGTVTASALADPQGRYPARSFDDFDPTYGGENIGSYIYDLQFEFYGKIAIALKSDGSPEVWGVGWGYQDVRGEDIGTDCDGQLTDPNDSGAFAIQSGQVGVAKGSDHVAPDATSVPSWPGTLSKLVGGTFLVWPSSYTATDTFDTADPNNDVYIIKEIDPISGTDLILNRPYTGATGTVDYRIIEPTQANGVLDAGEDLGADGLIADQLDDGNDIPNNVSDNDGDPNGDEYSVGEGNKRLDSRVMGVWDSRSPDPRNPRMAAELNGLDDDGDASVLQVNSLDDDGDGLADEISSDPEWDPEVDIAAGADETNDLIDNDTNGADGVVDDRFYEPAGKPEGIDEPDEADPYDDTLPKAVRITIAIRDSQQSLEPIVMSTVVWLSTAK